MDNVNLKELKDWLQNIIFEVFHFKPLISFRENKINDGQWKKSPRDFSIRVLHQNKQKMDVHAEAIGLQQDSVRQALKLILASVERDLHGINFRLVPVFMHKTHKNIATRLKQVAMNYMHVSSNIEYIK